MSFTLSSFASIHITDHTEPMAGIENEHLNADLVVVST